MSLFVRLSLGFTAIFRGLGLIVASRRLKTYAIVPFTLDLILIICAVWYGIKVVPVWVDSALLGVVRLTQIFLAGVIDVPTGVVQTLYYIVLPVVWLSFMLMVFFVTYLFAIVIAAPFNSLLAERALIELGTLQNEKFRMRSWVSVSTRMLLVSLLKAAIFLPIGIILFVISFIPGINIIATVGFMLMVAFDSADYSFEALRFGLRRRLSYFTANFAEFLGLAMALGLILIVPGLNFVMLPAAVAGCSDLVSRIEKRRKASSGSGSHT